jgi:Zn-dependent protease with chaperone function
MHVGLLLAAVGIAILLRMGWWQPTSSWQQRWQLALVTFLVPAIFVCMAAIAVLVMGTQGRMFHLPVGWAGYGLGVGFLGLGTVYVAWSMLRIWKSIHEVRCQPYEAIGDSQGRVIEVPLLFAGQIGWWQPELVVSRGLLTHLSPEQIQAVLAHEQAHQYYRDTFWFFWLGWLRQITAWLPKTEMLWQELLLLRELRADRKAAQSVDPLVLAEALVLVARYPLRMEQPDYVALNDDHSGSRLEVRVECLLSEALIGKVADEETSNSAGMIPWYKYALVVLPLLTVMIHHG